MIPLSQSAFWSPMAFTIMGGLSVATFLPAAVYATFLPAGVYLHAVASALARSNRRARPARCSDLPMAIADAGGIGAAGVARF